MSDDVLSSVRDRGGVTYRFVTLIEIVDIAVQDLDEQLDGRCGFHARVGDAQSPLKAFEHPLAITIELWRRLVSGPQPTDGYAYL